MQDGETVAPATAVAQPAPEPSTHSEETEKKSNQHVTEISSVKSSPIGSLGALVLIATIVALLGTGALFLYKTSRTGRLETETGNFDNLQAKLGSEPLNKMSADLQEIMDGQSSLETALKGRIYWSLFWSKLGSATPKSVYYTTLAIDGNGVVSVGGMANDLTSIAKLMVSLRNAQSNNEYLFQNIKLGNTSVRDFSGKTMTAFSVTFNVNSNQLKK